jgi:hypothetical protein
MSGAIAVEFSRRRTVRNPLNWALYLINQSKDFVALEIVDRDSGIDAYTPNFRLLYVPKIEYELLIEHLKEINNVCGKVFLCLEPISPLLKQYRITEINPTNDLCNYITV